MATTGIRTFATLLLCFTAAGCNGGSGGIDGDHSDEGSDVPALSVRWDLGVRPEVDGLPQTDARLVVETAAEQGLGNPVEELALGVSVGRCQLVAPERMKALAPDAITAIECGLADIADVTRIVRKGRELQVIRSFDDPSNEDPNVPPRQETLGTIDVDEAKVSVVSAVFPAWVETPDPDPSAIDFDLALAMHGSVAETVTLGSYLECNSLATSAWSGDDSVPLFALTCSNGIVDAPDNIAVVRETRVFDGAMVDVLDVRIQSFVTQASGQVASATQFAIPTGSRVFLDEVSEPE